MRANLDWLVTDKEAQYIAIVKRNQPLLHAKVRALSWRQVPAGSLTRERGHGPANLATIRVTIIAAIQDAGYLHIPEGRRDHTTAAETLRLHGLD